MWVRLSEVHTCERSSLIPPGQTRECCSVSFLLLHSQHCPSVARAAVVSAGAGPVVGSHVKPLSERLRAAQPSTSHLKDQSWGIGKECSWEGLLQSWIKEVNTRQVPSPCPLSICTHAQFKSRLYSQAQCCSLQKSQSYFFNIIFLHSTCC